MPVCVSGDKRCRFFRKFSVCAKLIIPKVNALIDMTQKNVCDHGFIL